MMDSMATSRSLVDTVSEGRLADGLDLSGEMKPDWPSPCIPASLVWLPDYLLRIYETRKGQAIFAYLGKTWRQAETDSEQRIHEGWRKSGGVTSKVRGVQRTPIDFGRLLG